MPFVISLQYGVKKEVITQSDSDFNNPFTNIAFYFDCVVKAIFPNSGPSLADWEFRISARSGHLAADIILSIH
jgi:hypothetical protein